MLDIKIPDPPTSPSLISLNGFCGRKAECFFLSLLFFVLRMYLWWGLYTLYLLARQVELPKAIQVFVVVSLVCRALLFGFVC